MTDIFDAKILCKDCNIQMKPSIVERNGFELRAVKCDKCGEKIIHPADLNGFEQFNNLRGRTFNVKLRVVGNSHAISIPKEIVDFINDQHKNMRRQMDDMVSLCFEDFETLRLSFGDNNFFENDEEESLSNRHDRIEKMKIKKIKRIE